TLLYENRGERWGDGEMGRWGDGEIGRWGVLDISHSSNPQINSHPFFINYFSLRPIFWRYC
ncbi:hypothetical protein ACP6PK_20860, partial [Dapis sp. BLCC M172]